MPKSISRRGQACTRQVAEGDGAKQQMEHQGRSVCVRARLCSKTCSAWRGTAAHPSDWQASVSSMTLLFCRWLAASSPWAQPPSRLRHSRQPVHHRAGPHTICTTGLTPTCPLSIRTRATGSYKTTSDVERESRRKAVGSSRAPLHTLKTNQLYMVKQTDMSVPGIGYGSSQYPYRRYSINALHAPRVAIFNIGGAAVNKAREEPPLRPASGSGEQHHA